MAKGTTQAQAKETTATVTSVVNEQPTHGGSYLRNPDGSLNNKPESATRPVTATAATYPKAKDEGK